MPLLFQKPSKRPRSLLDRMNRELFNKQTEVSIEVQSTKKTQTRQTEKQDYPLSGIVPCSNSQ